MRGESFNKLSIFISVTADIPHTNLDQWATRSCNDSTDIWDDLLPCFIIDVSTELCCILLKIADKSLEFSELVIFSLWHLEVLVVSCECEMILPQSLLWVDSWKHGLEDLRDDRIWINFHIFEVDCIDRLPLQFGIANLLKLFHRPGYLSFEYRDIVQSNVTTDPRSLLTRTGCLRQAFLALRRFIRHLPLCHGLGLRFLRLARSHSMALSVFIWLRYLIYNKFYLN